MVNRLIFAELYMMYYLAYTLFGKNTIQTGGQPVSRLGQKHKSKRITVSDHACLHRKILNIDVKKVNRLIPQKYNL